jgi:hypothetical protein
MSAARVLLCLIRSISSRRFASASAESVFPVWRIIVEVNHRQASGLGRGQPEALAEVPVPKRRTCGAGKDECVMLKRAGASQIITYASADLARTLG